MRASRTFQLQTLVLLYLTTFAAAWPLKWPRWMPELDSLIVRAESSSSAASATPTATKAAATATDTSTPSSETDSSNTESGSGGTTYSMSYTGTTTKATGSSKATTSKAQTTSYDAALPAGGVSLMTPAVASGSQYYKIGNFITFAWNYTSLEATPTAVNVLASCSANAQTYTIASNLTVSLSTSGNSTIGKQQIIWDTGAYQATAVQNPLLTQTYTLIIYDAASSISAVAAAGYLSPYDTYSFGMYMPQAYTPLGEYSCATCSGALSEGERRALGVVLGMGILTVLSFSWFVGGTGVIW